jgi:hypothetical protein
MTKAILIAVIAAIIALFIPTVNVEAVSPVIEVEINDEMEWAAYHVDAYEEYADEFTALFNSYETKVAKNGAMMIRQGNSGPFKFARKG